PPPVLAGEPVVVPPRVALALAVPAVAPAPLDDVAPAPDAARVDAAPDGDRVLAPAEGDPYFLGFVAGRYYPPTGERVDPELLASIQPDPRDGRPQPVVYAFAMFERRITAERTAELERLGARVLGYHPSNCVKLAIPVDAFEAVAAHPELHWLGTPKRWQRLHPAVARMAASARDGVLELVVDVYESDLDASAVVETFGGAVQSDGGVVLPAPQGTALLSRVRSNGWQARALAAAGSVVGEYEDSIRAFRVRAPAARVDALAALDFVQFIEPDLERRALHDDSTPLIYSDSARYYANGGASSSVIAGIIDSGFDIAHTDLNHTWGVGWGVGGSGGPWNDPCEHGTHVAGTLLGNGATDPTMRGNAPGLGWGGAGRFYVVKTSDVCSGWSGALSTWLAPFHTPYFDGASTTPVPQVINNSWGTSVWTTGGVYVGPWYGTEADARELDTEVYARGQMHVFAAGNDGPSVYTTGLQGAAKNVFTVGSVDDFWTWGTSLPGEVSGFSSRGPTGDYRWKPNLAAPGDSIQSVDANSGNGYSSKSGTSMAAPHVTGVAVQMLDHLPFLKYAPERTASLLMATAMTKGNQTLTFPTENHLDDYGAGKVEAWKANYGSAQMGWSNWGSYLPANNYTWADFTVSPGCTRLVVCMNYVEPQSSAGASQALVNNYDLIIDGPAIDPNFNTGDYVAQQSGLDNTEIRILDNPISGTWRWKIWPTYAPQGAYYGLTVYAQYGDITPNMSLSVTPAKAYVKPYEYIDVGVSAYSPTYLASNVVIDANCQTGNGFSSTVEKYLNDGPFVTEFYFGSKPRVLLGDILHDNTRSATFDARWGDEGIWGFVASVRGDNIATVSSMGVVTVDGTAPSGVDPLECTDHTVDTWSNDPFFDFQWAAASDNLSGIGGYSRSTSYDAPATPDEYVETTLTTLTDWLPSSAQPYYFNVRAVDRSLNGGAPSSIGPFWVDQDAPSALTGLYADIGIDGITCSSITLAWDEAADALSGLAGYSVMIDDDPSTTPSGSLDTLTPSYTATLPVSALPYYAHVSAVDVAGNVGPEAHHGPFYFGDPLFTSFCPSKPHSGGCTATTRASGCPSYASSGDFHVYGDNVLGDAYGRLLWSVNQNPLGVAGLDAFSPSLLGTKVCLFRASPLAVQYSGGTPGACDGSFDTALDEAFFQANGLVPGTTVYVQYVFSDPGAFGQSGQTNGSYFQVAP
ncbi:MAG: S8 family serine peptidase, partial [Planctomycetes bacterium]|nr:S8 family serine peptidase [Planctomycetota bacterium]